MRVSPFFFKHNKSCSFIAFEKGIYDFLTRGAQPAIILDSAKSVLDKEERHGKREDHGIFLSELRT